MPSGSSVGMAARNSSMAARPPADAPMPTTGKAARRRSWRRRLAARRRRGLAGRGLRAACALPPALPARRRLALAGRHRGPHRRDVTAAQHGSVPSGGGIDTVAAGAAQPRPARHLSPAAAWWRGSRPVRDLLGRSREDDVVVDAQLVVRQDVAHAHDEAPRDVGMSVLEARRHPASGFASQPSSWTMAKRRSSSASKVARSRPSARCAMPTAKSYISAR